MKSLLINGKRWIILKKRFSAYKNAYIYTIQDEEGNTEDVNSLTDPKMAKALESAQVMKGDAGTPGKDGYSPIPGVDFLTKKELDSIVNEIVSECMAMIPMPKDGTPGKDGVVPKAGVDYPTMAQVREWANREVNLLAKKLQPTQVKEIKTVVKEMGMTKEEIKDFIKENIPKKDLLSGGGGSFVGLAKVDTADIPGTLEEKLIAGSNITITKGTNDNGTKKLTIASTGGSSGGHTIQDEGTPLTQRTNLNFVGAGVAATDDAGNDATVITISGGGSGSVDSVVAGNNIDVDATDPANPIVSVETLTLADISDVTSSAAEVNVLDGIPATLTATELGYVDGVTSAIQTQLNAKQPLDAQLTDVAGLTPTDNGVIIGNGSNFVVESGATLKTSLGLTIGTDIQAYDADLTTWAGLTPSAFFQTLVDDSDAATARTTLGLVSGGTGDIWVEKTGDSMSGNLAITIPSAGNVLAATIVQNDTTNNPKAFSVTNAGTGNAIYIDANGNTGTTAGSSGALFLDNTNNTGTGANFYTNGATVGSTGVLYAKVDNSSASGPVTRLDNDGTGPVIKINDTGAKGTSDSNSGALNINMSHATDVGIAANIHSLNVGTSHNLLRINSQPAYSTTVSGAQTIDTSSTQLTVSSTASFPTSGTIRVLNNSSQTENARSSFIHYTSVDATHFIGTAGVFYKESTSVSVIDTAIVEYLEPTKTASLVQVIDNGLNGGMVNLKLQSPNPDLEFVATGGYDSSIGEGKFEIDVPTGDNVTRVSTDCIRINGRADANNSFDTIMVLTRPGVTRQGMVGIGFQNLASPTALAAHFHVKNDTNFGDTNAASLISSIFQGAASQTANLTEWRNDSGTVLSSVSSAGVLFTPSIELGAASDTTLARASAGVLSVEGKTLVNLTDGGTFLADVSVPDEVYGSGWNGSVEVPTKNAVYDQMELKLAATAYDDATAAETTTGTSTTKYVSPDGLAGSDYGKRVVGILVSDPNGDAITTGDGKATFRIPSVMNGWNLVSVAASVSTVSSSGTPTVQIRNATQAVDMLTTKITIDASETDSSTAAAAAVIDTANDDVATGDAIFIDIDVAGTGAKGLYVELQFQLP